MVSWRLPHSAVRDRLGWGTSSLYEAGSIHCADEAASFDSGSDVCLQWHRVGVCLRYLVKASNVHHYSSLSQRLLDITTVDCSPNHEDWVSKGGRLSRP